MPQLLSCDFRNCPYELGGYESQKFCTLECTNIHHKKRIELACNGCKKKFALFPYLQRNTNYCSMKCYWDTTRRTKVRKCRHCKKSFLAPRFLTKKGFGIYCSRECQHKTYPDRLILSCLLCKKDLSVPPSKQDLVKFCSTKCKDDYKRDYVQCTCKQCHHDFQIPRSDINRGRGTFCTWDCFIRYKGESSIEEKIRLILEKNRIPFKQEVKFKRFHVDFLLQEKKLAIECDGEFWHMQDKIRKRDTRKDKMLKDLGYKVLRLSGQLIKKSSEKKLLQLVQMI